MSYKMQIPPDKVEQTRKFFRERGGCLLWKNLDLSSYGTPEIMTPATHEDGSKATPPTWRHGDPVSLIPAEIGVRTEDAVALPPEWFIECEYCHSTGRRAISELAEARGESFDECKAFLIENNKDRPEHLDLKGSTIRCWVCSGNGYTDVHVHVEIRRRYWGIDISERGKERASRWCRRLEKHYAEDIRPVQFYWQHIDKGLAELKFYRETIVPFTLTGV
jgi:hypothetical protein